MHSHRCVKRLVPHRATHGDAQQMLKVPAVLIVAVHPRVAIRMQQLQSSHQASGYCSFHLCHSLRTGAPTGGCLGENMVTRTPTCINANLPHIQQLQGALF
ncbi:hypothetical protein GN956_G19437 [Arapaima gigas]